MTRKQWMQLAVGVLISAAALYVIFKDIDFVEFLNAFRAVNAWWLAPCLAAFYVSVWLRGIRWSWLFRPAHDVPLRRGVAGIFICFAFNSVFPARLGEFARAYLVGKRDKTGISTALGTVVAERLLDVLVIIASLAITLAVVPIPEDAKFSQTVLGRPVGMTGQEFLAIKNGFILMLVVLLLGVVAVGVPVSRRLMLRAMHTMTFLPEGLRHKLEDLVNKFAQGFACFSSAGRVLNLTIISLAIWMLNAASVLLLAWGYPFANSMTFMQSLALVMIVCVFITLPAAPGYWGFYEAGVIFGVTIMGIHPNTPLVLSYAILLHLTQWLPIIAVGLPLAWKSHVSLSDTEQAQEQIS